MKAPNNTFEADLTARQAVGLCIALCLGTAVEWYDFTIYSQFSSTLTQVFFPKDNPATAALAFWGVYAVGFISRPVGAVIFGHIGDSIGRRLSLLLSILLITVPTAVIGALPTYEHVGIAAPVLLAVLRFLQGVAIGGEFGSAIVYLYELAPKHRKGVIASLGQQASAPGIIFGISACLAIIYACTPDQLLVWGWRIPFLATIITTPIALTLRMHMPEPSEFLHSKQEMVLQRVADKAAAKVATNYTQQQHGLTSHEVSRLTSREIIMRLQSLTRITLDMEHHEPPGKHKIMSGKEDSKASRSQHPPVQPSPRMGSSTPPQAAGSRTRKHMLARELSIASEVQLHLNQNASGALHDLSCEREYAAKLEELSKTIKHHVPLLVLLRHHWQGLWLQFFFEAVGGSMFYVFFSWVPSYLHTTTGVSTQMTLWALMISMGVFMITVPAAGYLVDKGVPKVWCYMGLTVLGASCSIPVMYALHSGSLVAVMVLLPFMIGLSGCLGGLLTSIGPQIYPSAIRTSGFNIGHNLAMSIWAGLSPLMISALALVLAPAALAAGVLVVILAVVSWIAAIPLTKVAPDTNAGDRCSCCQSDRATGEVDSSSKDIEMRIQGIDAA